METLEMLKIYGRASSVNVQRLLWAVDELGIPYERFNRGGKYGGIDGAEFGSMNPHRKIPTIDDGGVVVWESNAIIRYLASKHGPSSLWPDDPAQRAQADQWMDWSQSTLSADFYDLFFRAVRTPPSKKDKERIADAALKAGQHYTLLDRWLTHRKYMLGEDLSLADIAIGVTLHRYFKLLVEAQLPVPEQGALRAWYQRLAERPAYSRHVMVSYEELRAQDA
jgi:glutathione S-transferase